MKNLFITAIGMVCLFAVVIGSMNGEVAPTTAAKDISSSLFKEVSLFRRHSLFLTYDPEIKYMYPSLDQAFRYGDNFFGNQTPIFGVEFAVRPDGSGFYMCARDKILEFDGEAHCLRQIAAEEFGFPKEEAYFSGHAFASNTLVWFTVLKRNPKTDGTLGLETFIMEWKPELPPETRSISSAILGEYWAVDAENRKVYIPGSLIQVFDFNTQKTEVKSWGSYFFADYDKNRGLLLSQDCSRQNEKIVKVDLNTEKITEITEGSMAVWGADDFIYFRVGTTQLWRCKSDGSKREAVYCETKEFTSVENEIVPLVVSHDRTFLSFFHSPAYRPGPPWNMVLFDLKNKEYRKWPEKYVGTAGMGWLVKEDWGKTGLPKSIVPTPKYNFSDDLQTALLKKDVDQVKDIVKRGVDINAPDTSGYTPLLYAVQTGKTELVEIILNSGADIDPRDNYNNQTPLLWVLNPLPFIYGGKLTEGQALENQTAIATLLIDKGADVNAQGYNGDTPLHLAIEMANVEITKILLLKNANVNAKDREGDAPIHVVLNYTNENSYELVKLLVTLGKDIDLNARDNNGFTPLQKAKIYNESNEIIKLLQENGAKEQ